MKKETCIVLLPKIVITLFLFFLLIIFKSKAQNIEVPSSNTYNSTLDAGRPKLDAPFSTDRRYYGPTNEEYIEKISSGPTIKELINDINKIQSQNEELLNQQEKGGSTSKQNFEFDADKAFQDAKEELSNKSLQSASQPIEMSNTSEISINTEATESNTEKNTENIDISRFTKSPCFQTLGYNPNNPDLESEYVTCETQKRNHQFQVFLIVAVLIIIFLFAILLITKNTIRNKVKNQLKSID